MNILIRRSRDVVVPPLTYTGLEADDVTRTVCVTGVRLLDLREWR